VARVRFVDMALDLIYVWGENEREGCSGEEWWW
jgi:hypothetical protein